MSINYVDDIYMDLGEKTHMVSLVRPVCGEEIPFEIRAARWELYREDWEKGDVVLEAKIRWGNLIKKLRTLLFVNNRTTTEEGFGLDARQGKLIQDELDQLNTKIRIRSIQTASAKSGMVAEGEFSDNVAVDISKMGFKKAPIGIPVSKGYLEPRINSITTGTLNLGFYNAGPGSHSGECKVILIELY